MKYVGDIFQAAVALFLPNSKVALQMRSLLGVSEECSKNLYDIISGVAQRIDFLRDCSGLSLPSALSYLLQRVHSTSFDHLGFNNEEPFVSAGLKFVSHPGTGMRKRNSVDDSVNDDDFNKRFKHSSTTALPDVATRSSVDPEFHVVHVSCFVQGFFLRCSFFTLQT